MNSTNLNFKFFTLAGLIALAQAPVFASGTSSASNPSNTSRTAEDVVKQYVEDLQNEKDADFEKAAKELYGIVTKGSFEASKDKVLGKQVNNFQKMTVEDLLLLGNSKEGLFGTFSQTALSGGLGASVGVVAFVGVKKLMKKEEGKEKEDDDDEKEEEKDQ
ncbi:MAG: hypothetical protein AAF380_02960 [Bacteroidota bacterium]